MQKSIRLFIVAFLLPLSAWSVDKPGSRTFSIDSSYAPTLASNRGMANLWVEWEGFQSKIFDIGSGTFIGKNFATRFLWATAMYIGSDYLHYGFFVGSHELGHGTRVLSIGGDPKYAWNGGSSDASIFAFIAKGFSKYGSGAVTNSTMSKYSPPDYSIAISAGGMNASMMFGEALEDEVFYNTGHLNQMGAYIYAKLDGYRYVRGSLTAEGTGDVITVVNAWNAKGYNVTKEDISQGSLNSILASSTTYAYLWSLGRYIGTGNVATSAPMIGKFKLPDVSFFQNRNGISYRVRSAFDFGSYVIPFSVETVTKGEQNKASEYSLGVRLVRPIKGLRKAGSLVQIYGSTKGGTGFRFSKDFAVGSSSLLSLGGSMFNLSSLEGERNMGAMSSSFVGTDVWTKYTYIF